MRVDNGEPFGTPKKNPTTPLALWLIANDIDMIFNKPYCPQMNAKVEKMQDTTARWAEINSCENIVQLQTQLDAQVLIQREQYKVTRLNNQTRLEAFPELETSRRIFSIQDFNAQRVYDYLSKKNYPRKVSLVGQISHFGHKIQVSRQYQGQYLSIKLNATDCTWHIFDNQNLITTIKADSLSADKIMTMTVFQ
jgi:hypothetical protein